MSSPSARRLGVLTAALLTVGLLAPTAVSAAPTGSAATFGQRGSAFSDEGTMSTFASTPVEVRDLSDACPTGRVPAGGFGDVAKGSTFSRAIDCLVWYEITMGKTSTSYGPTDLVTRQQMAVFIYRMLDDILELPAAPTKSQFRDVPATGEAGTAINVLASPQLADMLGVKVVTGKTTTSFDPKGRVTRAQMGSFIARTLEGVFHATGVSIIDRGNCDGYFRDEASIPTSHRDNVKLLCAFGIVTGRTDGTYGPVADVNRGQMAAFLMRLVDLFVEAGVTVPPDFFAEVHVDRGTGVTACSNTGRNGTVDKPFCSIQAGIDAAAAMSGRWVDVFVQPRVEPYAEDVVLASGQAFQVDVGSGTEDLVLLNGSIRVNGADESDANFVYGFDILGATTGVDVRSPGAVALVSNVIDAPTAISVDQTGLTWVAYSYIAGSAVGIDLVNTSLMEDLTGTYVEETMFDAASDAYVRAPSTASNTLADTNLNAWLGDTTNHFPTGAALGESLTRRAIVPTP